MTPDEEKAALLTRQGRHAQAEAAIRALIAQRPEVGYLRQMLARSLDRQGKHVAAMGEAREAVRLDPEDPVAYYTLSSVHVSLDELKEADEAMDRAIELDPRDPDWYEMRALVRLRQDDWAGVLEAAEAGLAIDPEHNGCLGFRGQALSRLGRGADARAAFGELLARDPEDDVTHCNLGWDLLYVGRHEEAERHFREALRIDPDYEHARRGLIEALKSRHTFYGLMIRGLVAMSRWPTWVQWAAVGVLFVGLNALGVATRESPPAVQVTVQMLNLVLLLLWVLVIAGSQLLLLTLRFGRDGRHMLSKTQRAASNWHAALLLMIVATLAGWPLIGLQAMRMLILVFGMLVAMVSEVYACPPGRPRRTMAAYVTLVGVFGVLGVPVIALWTAIGLIHLNLLFLSLMLVMHHLKLFVIFAIGALGSDAIAKRLILQHARRERAEAD